MTRAKTKVGESLEYIRGDGERRRWIGPPGSTIKDDRRTLRAAISTGVIHTGEGRVDMRGARVIRVTRYRLAPLIELPAWSESCPGYWNTCLPNDGAASFSSITRMDPAEEPAGNLEWLATRANCNGFADTFEEARTACEARLLELGYRVARPK